MNDAFPAAGVGIDIGGTSTKAALLDATGAVIHAASAPTVHGVPGLVATAVELTRSIVAAAGLTMSDVASVGVGVPGTVDPVVGTVRFAVNVGLGAEPADLGGLLSNAFGCRVHVENDVRAAALGADWYLASHGKRAADLAYLSIGTGIAAGFVSGGQLRRGSSSVAGEIGHVPIDPAGPLCACGQRGCIEAIASGAAIERAWPTADGTSATALHAAATAGEPAAVSAWTKVVGALGNAVLMLALTFDPEVIVIGGGVATLGPRLHDALAGQLALAGRTSEFLASLDLGARLRVVDPSVPLGPIGALRAAISPDADLDAVAAS